MWYCSFSSPIVYIPIRDSSTLPTHASALLHDPFIRHYFCYKTFTFEIFPCPSSLNCNGAAFMKLALPLLPGELVPTVLAQSQIIAVLYLAAILFYMTISCTRNITSLWTDSMYYSLTLMFNITSAPFGLSVLYRTDTETGFQLILRVGSRCDIQ